MEGRDKRVMIVGGTGLLGYHAALELLKREYQVTALALEDVDLKGWYPEEIQVVHADVFTIPPEQLIALMKGHHAMVYAMGPDDRSIPEFPASRFFREKLVDTSARVFDAARRAGVKRSVLLGSYFHHFHRLMPHLGLAVRHPYIKARIEQETAVLDVAGKGMDVMILELPYIFGTMPNRVPLWKEVFFDRLLKMNPVLYPNGGTSMICVENVAEAIAGAISKGVHAQRYAIGDQNLQWKEMFAIMFGAIGVRRRIIHIPYWTAAMAGRYMMFRERRRSREPGLNLAYIFRDIISRDFFLEPAQTAALLGYGSSDIREAIAETARACFPLGYKSKVKN
jgi:nucleoside-diphosphate-sugar epimerase